jgi:RND family efflux transporter MFP subunit
MIDHNNKKYMKKNCVLMTVVAIIIIAGCGSGAKEGKNDLADLKKKLESKKKEKSDAEAEIKSLEEKIAKLDTTARQQNQKLVSVSTLTPQNFVHYIELQGKVDADDIVTVMPRTTMGLSTHVTAVYVKRGDFVKKGDLLAKLDDAVMLQQVDALKTQLAYAVDIYNRQKNLWDQGIGTEVQLITAKNNVDALNRQIATMQENWKTSFIYAPLSGIADQVNIKEGEVYGANPMVPPIQIVNMSSMKVVTEVPENYQEQVKKGSILKISIPDAGIDSLHATISVMGASINPNSRAFTTEAKISSNPALRVNQVAIVRIQDHAEKNVIVVPVNMVQADEKGKYVYVMVKEGDKTVARKKVVEVGDSYNNMIEIKAGLSAGEQIITEGYQSVYDGQSVTTGTK